MSFSNDNLGPVNRVYSNKFLDIDVTYEFYVASSKDIIRTKWYRANVCFFRVLDIIEFIGSKLVKIKLQDSKGKIITIKNYPDKFLKVGKTLATVLYGYTWDGNVVYKAPLGYTTFLNAPLLENTYIVDESVCIRKVISENKKLKSASERFIYHIEEAPEENYFFPEELEEKDDEAYAEVLDNIELVDYNGLYDSLNKNKSKSSSKKSRDLIKSCSKIYVMDKALKNIISKTTAPVIPNIKKFYGRSASEARQDIAEALFKKLEEAGIDINTVCFARKERTKECIILEDANENIKLATVRFGEMDISNHCYLNSIRRIKEGKLIEITDTDELDYTGDLYNED